MTALSITPRAVRWATALLVLAMVLAWSGAPRDLYAWGGLALTLGSASRRPLALRDNPALVALLGFVAWALVGTLWAPHPALAIRDWVKLATLAAFAWTSAQLMASGEDEQHVTHVLRCLCVALVIVYAAEIAGWLRTIGASWRAGERPSETLSFQNVNTFAGLVVATTPLAWLLVRSDWRWRGALVGLQLVCGGFLLWLFASRTAQLAAAAVVVAALAGQRRAGMRWLAAVALVACVAAAPSLNPRFRDGTMWTLHNRAQLWRGTVTLIAARPLFGYGWGDKTFQPVYAAHDPDRPEDWPHTHNLALQVAFGVGVVGLALYAATFGLVLGPLWRARRAADPDRARVARVLLLSAVAIAVFSLADVPRGPFHLYLWAWWGAALALVGVRSGPPAAPS